MAVTQIADVVVPAEFSAYIVAQSLTSTALFQSDVLVKNGEMESQLQAGATQFTVPFWVDPADGGDADVTSDDPTVPSVPLKVTAGRQQVRKSFLHQSWSEMSLASELSGDNALSLVQQRVSAYWDRQFQKRLIASLKGVLFSNVANNSSDMVNDISGATGTAASFNGEAVIDTALTLGDRLGDVKSIAVHSAIYGEMLKNNEVQFFKPSENAIEIPTYKGMSIVISDSLTPASGVYTSILMGAGAVGLASSAFMGRGRLDPSVLSLPAT